MELIDKTELINSLKLLVKFEDTNRASVILGVIETVKRQKLIDAVTVVRCKDCEYGSNMPLGLCYLHYENDDKNEVCVEPNDFCSYGKKKTT